jgi:hypothetical protein
MINIKEIIDAWSVSFNPTQTQLNKSIERGRVCEICPSRKVITKKLKLATICGECGCPISKKIFSLEFNPCPLNKWEEVDKKYKIEEKTNKTFI